MRRAGTIDRIHIVMNAIDGTATKRLSFRQLRRAIGNHESKRFKAGQMMYLAKIIAADSSLGLYIKEYCGKRSLQYQADPRETL